MISRSQFIIALPILATLTLTLTLTSRSQTLSAPNRHLGMCDASAGVALNSTSFAVANDEDNTIRIYSSRQSGRPLNKIDLSQFLKLQPDKNPETDFEGATWLGNRIFWITSHGRNREGKYRANRHRFFATDVSTNRTVPDLLPVGRPYQYLLQDLIDDPRLKPFKLGAASALPPKSRGALNIEGLCATPEHHLLIGFRNPIPQGRALLVPLLNPEKVIYGLAPKFGDPVLLDLDGRGIRDITYTEHGYLLIAGRYDGGGASRLYRWKGDRSSPKRIKKIDLSNFNPEALIIHPTPERRIQLLSDDGTKKIDGIPCKLLPNPAARSFRSVWVTLTNQ